jgi:hypothetical protein
MILAGGGAGGVRGERGGGGGGGGEVGVKVNESRVVHAVFCHCIYVWSVWAFDMYIHISWNQTKKNGTTPLLWSISLSLTQHSTPHTIYTTGQEEEGEGEGERVMLGSLGRRNEGYLDPWSLLQALKRLSMGREGGVDVVWCVCGWIVWYKKG